MDEQLRLLKVIVVQGKRLVIRDFKSSDPYVVVKLGNQVTWIYISILPYVYFFSYQKPYTLEHCKWFIIMNQTAKTRVIHCSLNPVWNEELSFTLTEPFGFLNLVSFLIHFEIWKSKTKFVRFKIHFSSVDWKEEKSWDDLKREVKEYRIKGLLICSL